MFENIDWEAFIIAGIVAYTLAFYFKNLSNLVENKGWIFFIFFHLPVFFALVTFSTALETENNKALTLFFASVFLLRFFRKDV